MSIVIGTQPNQIAPAYNENIWKVTSDRDDPVTDTVTVVADNGGFTEYTVGSHSFLVGDVITGSGFTETTYNVIQTVTAISGTTVTTGVTFVATDTGTLTRTNNDFQILGEIVEFGVNSVLTVSDTQDGGTNRVNFVTTVAHGYEVGDIVIVSGTTSYNKMYKVVLFVSATVFKVVEAFVGNESGSVEKGEIRGSKTAKIDTDGINYIFNFQNILSSIVNKDGYDLIALGSTTIQTPTNNSIRSYGVLFTEQYDGDDGLQKDQDVNQTNTVKKSVNIARQLGETLDLDADFLTNSVTRRFLTSSTSPKDLQDSQEEQLSFIANDGESYKIRSEQFDANGGSLGVTTTGSVAISNNRGIVPVNNNMWTDAVDTLDVWLVDGADVQVSEKRNFKVVRNCFRNKIEIYFLNRSGGHDLYTFTGDMIEAIETSKTKFKKVVPIGFDIEERSQTTLGVQGNNRIEVFSQFLTRAEGIWLAEYVSSPEVVLLDSSNFVPIDPKNKSEVLDRDAGLTQIKGVFTKPDLIIQSN